MTYIHHLTITTGHTRKSYRNEVASDIIDTLQATLSAAIAGQLPPLPGDLSGYHLSAGAVGRCLMATVWAPPKAVPSRPTPLVTIGVAARSRCAADLWGRLVESHPAPLQPAMPDAPWCAVQLQPGIMSDIGAMGWLGDFERCLAWAWLERQ